MSDTVHESTIKKMCLHFAKKYILTEIYTCPKNNIANILSAITN